MPVKKDASGRRWISVEAEVPGTPEQVWKAIATGPGISAWFVPSSVEERQGGLATASFGPGMDSAATITQWDPPHRFVTQSKEGSGLGPDAPSVADEWTVEARSGGTCIVRVVHSLYSDKDDWDNQLEGFESGWPSFFRVLRRYLRHFAGQPSALVQVTAMSTEPFAKAWATLAAAMHRGEPKPGQRLSLAVTPAVTFAGGIERVDDLKNGRNVEVALDQPVPGTLAAGAFDCGGTMVQVSVYLYGSRAEQVANAARPQLQQWLTERFPAAAAQG